MPSPAAVAGNIRFWQRWGRGMTALAVLIALLAVAAILRPLWSGWRSRQIARAV